MVVFDHSYRVSSLEQFQPSNGSGDWCRYIRRREDLDKLDTTQLITLDPPALIALFLGVGSKTSPTFERETLLLAILCTYSH